MTMSVLFFTLSPLYRVGNIFGVAMFKPNQNDKKITNFVVNKNLIIYGELLVLLLMILHILCLFFLVIYTPVRDLILTLVFSFQIIIALAYLASCGFTNYYFRKTYVTILNQLSIIDEKFRNNNISINYKSGFRFSLIFILINIINSILFILLLYIPKGNDIKYKYIYAVCEVFFIYIRGLSLLQFKILLIILSERFDCLQKHLERVISDDKNFKINIKNIVFETSVLHRSLCNIIVKINSIFGLQLLLYIISAFLATMTYLYDICNTILKESILLSVNDDLRRYSVSLLWINYFGIHLIILCSICGNLNKKVSLY